MLKSKGKRKTEGRSTEKRNAYAVAMPRRLQKSMKLLHVETVVSRLQQQQFRHVLICCTPTARKLMKDSKVKLIATKVLRTMSKSLPKGQLTRKLRILSI
jgi:hypothetical protein